jgi:hypothetical protein
VNPEGLGAVASTTTQTALAGKDLQVAATLVSMLGRPVRRKWVGHPARERRDARWRGTWS